MFSTGGDSNWFPVGSGFQNCLLLNLRRNSLLWWPGKVLGHCFDEPDKFNLNGGLKGSVHYQNTLQILSRDSWRRGAHGFVGIWAYFCSGCYNEVESVWRPGWWGQGVLQAPACQNYLTVIRRSPSFSKLPPPSGSQWDGKTTQGSTKKTGHTYNWPNHSRWGATYHPEHVFGPTGQAGEHLQKQQEGVQTSLGSQKNTSMAIPEFLISLSFYRLNHFHNGKKKHSPPRRALPATGTGTGRWWRERWGSDTLERWETCRKENTAFAKCQKLNISRVEKKSLKITHTSWVLIPRNSGFQRNPFKPDGCGKSGGQKRLANTCTRVYKRQMPLIPFHAINPGTASILLYVRLQSCVHQQGSASGAWTCLFNGLQKDWMT